MYLIIVLPAERSGAMYYIIISYLSAAYVLLLLILLLSYNFVFPSVECNETIKNVKLIDKRQLFAVSVKILYSYKYILFTFRKNKRSQILTTCFVAEILSKFFT